MMENRVCSCRMKADLEESENKLLFLEDNWPSLFDEIECGSAETKENLCARCLLSIAVRSIQCSENYRRLSFWKILRKKWSLLIHGKFNLLAYRS